jgi:hypothetical protein
MTTPLLSAQFTDQELAQRQQARAGVRPTLPDPAPTARALALAICEVEAGLRSASQLERICHPSLWDAVANRIQRAGGPPVSGTSVLRVQVQELTSGLVDAVKVPEERTVDGQRPITAALRLGGKGRCESGEVDAEEARPARKLRRSTPPSLSSGSC